MERSNSFLLLDNPFTTPFEVKKLPGNFVAGVPLNDFYVSPPSVKMDALAEEVIKKELTAAGKLKDIRLPLTDAGKTLAELLAPHVPGLKQPTAPASEDPDNAANKRGPIAPPPLEPTLKERLIKDGHSAVIAKVSKRIRNSNIDHTARWLLSFEPIYVWALFKAVYDDQVTDEDGIFSRVLKQVGDVKKFLAEKLTDAVIAANRLSVSQTQRNEAVARIVALDMSYLAGKVEPFVLQVISEINTFGNLPDLVDAFFLASKNEIDPRRATPKVKSLMVHYLDEIGLKATNFRVGASTDAFDEYLALAYTYALKNSNNQDDPLKNIYNGSIPDTWDYSVDYFETTEQQGILPENIRAAGTLYYIHVIADQLRVLPIADAILMAWTSGRLDIPQGSTSTKLYRYYKLREERSTPEERAMFYKLVLNIGDAKVMDQMAVNTEFTPLWDSLMTETVKYIHKFEQRDNAYEVVSKQGVFQSMRDLQYNLTVHTSGMVKQLLPEMYAQLQSALELLQEPEIVNQLGYGYNKSMWKVIERVSQEEFGAIPNISALRTSAVKGHKIFSTLAFFDEAQFPEETFREFINDVESFIIAQSQLASGNGNGNGSHDAEEEFQAAEDEWDF
jgi:hypothetical protein